MNVIDDARTVMTWSRDTKAYLSGTGMKLSREYGLTPNGNPLGGHWVLRDTDGNMVAFDQYRNDLAERHKLKLVGYE
jgi:hypothetical protein